MYPRVIIIALVAAAGTSSAKSTAPGADHSGISQFWTDDYKVFDQIYGRTSDKDLFGATLPQGYGIDLSKFNHQPVDKKERFLDNDPANSDVNDDQVDPFLFGSKYQFTNQLKGININTKKFSAKKPEKSYKFISTDFKPISQNTDPETYNYLKHLEQLQKDKLYPEVNSGFKPYLSYGTVGEPNPEESDAYKSIQDILDAHEGNKGKKEKFIQDDAKYITYDNYKGRPSKNKKPKVRPPVTKSSIRICPSGRCRKRATNSIRYRTVPYVRKIKKVVTY